MTDRPILFSGPMIRALIEGRKTQTRRVLKIRGHKSFSQFGPSDTNGYDWHFRDAERRWHDYRHHDLLGRLPVQAGDRLWVRETWADMAKDPLCDLARAGMTGIAYRATDDDEMTIPPEWRPSIHMRRRDSRLTLIVTDVRVQRLHEISEDDAIAEGVTRDRDGWRHYIPTATQCCVSAADSFRTLWHSLNDKRGYGWHANPWVSAITFTVHHHNIDQMGAA